MDVLKPFTCMNCHKVNPPTANYCLKCGQPLTEKAAKEQKGIIESLNAITHTLAPEQLAVIVDLVEKKRQEKCF